MNYAVVDILLMNSFDNIINALCLEYIIRDQNGLIAPLGVGDSLAIYESIKMDSLTPSYSNCSYEEDILENTQVVKIFFMRGHLEKV